MAAYSGSVTSHGQTLSPMTKAPIPTESYKNQVPTQKANKNRLQTDLGRSVGVQPPSWYMYG